MTFLVKITNDGGDYFMRSTKPSHPRVPGAVWTGDIERADRFSTREAAQAALAAIEKFTKRSMFKLARIEEA